MEGVACILIQSLSADNFTDSCSTSIGTFSVAISRALVPQYPQEGVVHDLKCSGKGAENPRTKKKMSECSNCKDKFTSNPTIEKH